MAIRPKVFELDQVEADLRQQGVPEDRIAPTISLMRLVIPLAIQQVGADGIVDAVESAKSEWGLESQSNWVKIMAPYIVHWAAANIEKYKADRFDPPS